MALCEEYEINCDLKAQLFQALHSVPRVYSGRSVHAKSTAIQKSETKWGLEPLCGINTRRELIVLNRQGTQQQRPELPMVSPSDKWVNARYITLPAWKLKNLLCPFSLHSAVQKGFKVTGHKGNTEEVMQRAHVPVLGMSAFLQSAKTSTVTAVEMRSMARQDHNTCTLSPTCPKKKKKSHLC